MGTHSNRLLLVTLIAVSGCLGRGPDMDSPAPGDDGGMPPPPATDAGTDAAESPDMTQLFEAATPQSYVGKVKDILVGLPATDAEIAAVANDPNALAGLIDGWIAQPQFELRAEDFFRNAFQQNSVDLNTF